MKKFPFIVLLVAITLFSCKDSTKPQEQNQPEALTTTSDSRSSYKRWSGDLVNELYKDVLAKDSSLQAFEKKMNIVLESQSDSLKVYNDFKTKNDAYYISANSYIRQISDSIFRGQMDTILQKSKIQFAEIVKKHEEITKAIKENRLKIQDNYVAIKIKKTLPLIEKFQRESLPSTIALQGLTNEMKTVLEMQQQMIDK